MHFLVCFVSGVAGARGNFFSFLTFNCVVQGRRVRFLVSEGAWRRCNIVPAVQELDMGG